MKEKMRVEGMKGGIHTFQHSRLSTVISGDTTARNNHTVHLHSVKHEIENVAANIIEVLIHISFCRFSELLLEVGRFVV
jgi:hypothetical protein